MRIRLLGGFEVVVDGRRVPPVDWRRRHAAALVKLLALAPGRTLHREQVIDALWPNLCVDDAAPRLHKAAHYARRTLGEPQSLVLSHETVALLPDGDVDVDTVRFERLAESARDARTAGAAADAYPGDLLPHDRYEAWTESPRERLRLLYLRMLRQAGRWHEVADADSVDESPHLDWLERGLRELGVGPSPSLPRRGGVFVLRGSTASRYDGDWPYDQVLKTLVELRRNRPASPAQAGPIAVVII